MKPSNSQSSEGMEFSFAVADFTKAECGLGWFANTWLKVTLPVSHYSLL